MSIYSPLIFICVILVSNRFVKKEISVLTPAYSFLYNIRITSQIRTKQFPLESNPRFLDYTSNYLAHITSNNEQANLIHN